MKILTTVLLLLALTACSPAGLSQAENRVLYCSIGNTPTFISPVMDYYQLDDNTTALIWKNSERVAIHKLRPGESCVLEKENSELVKEQRP